MPSKYKIDYRIITTMGVAVICLVMLVIFPTQKENLFQQYVSGLAFLALIPFLYIRIILKKDVRFFGLQPGNVRKGIFWTAVSFATSFLMVFLAQKYLGLSEKYGAPQLIFSEFTRFLFYAFLITAPWAALYEFFFRGFLLFGTEENIGYWAVILQFAIFALMIAFFKNPMSMIFYVIAAPFSGIIAYQSRSLIYSFFYSWIFIVICSAAVIKFTPTP